MKKFTNRFRKLILIDASKKRGAAYARNIGAKAASGDIFLFCDADDVVGDGWVDAMAGALAAHDFVAGRLDMQALNGFPEDRGKHQFSGLQTYDYPPFFHHAGGGNLGVKRSVHEHIGGFDESWLRLMDTDYCWRIQLAGVKLYFEPSAVVYVRQEIQFECLKQAWLWGRHNVLA